MDYFLLTGALIFFFFSAFFLYCWKDSKKLNGPFLVSFITLVSYVVMLEGTFVETATTQAFGIQNIYWTRWIFYAFSCTLLVNKMAEMLKVEVATKVKWIYLTAILMVLGTLSSITTGAYMLLYFLLSSVAFGVLSYEIIKRDTKAKLGLWYYILFGWAIFPVFFILSPEGYALISNSVALAGYLALDIFTKLVFYIRYDK